jgi:hypothetical protein
MRLGMKCGPPQWMSEMCAIWNVRSAASMVEVYVAASRVGPIRGHCYPD